MADDFYRWRAARAPGLGTHLRVGHRLLPIDSDAIAQPPALEVNPPASALPAQSRDAHATAQANMQDARRAARPKRKADATNCQQQRPARTRADYEVDPRAR
eukprot:9502272-Pyramimonas_sp.AAC.1